MSEEFGKYAPCWVAHSWGVPYFSEEYESRCCRKCKVRQYRTTEPEKWTRAGIWDSETCIVKTGWRGPGGQVRFTNPVEWSTERIRGCGYRSAFNAFANTAILNQMNAKRQGTGRSAVLGHGL